ncbi:MAG: DUF2339 domain-containing protein [Candidatus Saccharibacteria bacterium]|nr:DUF2339 domain-containing protein [Pseudorhodobacter sp.]
MAVLLVLAMPVSIVVLLVGQSRLKARIVSVEARLAQQMVAVPVMAVPVMEDPAAVETRAVVATVEMGPAQAVADAAVPLQASEALSQPDDLVLPVPQPQGPIVMTAARASAVGVWMQRNWIYVISAASLALAGVFLVQYSVQNGLLPPLGRVMAAYLLGLGLIAGGEVVRRRRGDDEGSDTAYLPSVFAGAGLVTLFAASVAARQMYGLIGPELTFGLLMATAGLGVVLGWYYGPLLVAVGLIGGFAAPFMVGSDAGPTPLLYAYYMLIAATGLAVDAVRRWAWLSVLGLTLGYLGAALVAAGGAGVVEWVGVLLVIPALAIAVPPLRITPDQAGPTVLEALISKGRSGWPLFPVRLVAASVLTSSLGLLMLGGTSPAEAMLCFAALALMGVVLLIWCEPAPGLADMALIPGAAFLLRLLVEPANYGPLAADFFAQGLEYRPLETAAPLTVTWLVLMAAALSAVFAWRALRGGRLARVHGLAAVLMAPLAVAILEFQWLPALVTGPWVWALHAMVMAAAMVALATRFAARDGADHRRMAYATLSALSLIALALFLLISTTALTLALGVLLVTAAWLDRRFDLREMGVFLQIGTAVLSWRLLLDPGLDWAMYAPVLSVVVAFAGAIGAQVLANRLIAGRGRTLTSGVLESAALALTAVLANVLLSRWLVPMVSFSGSSSLDLNYAATLQAMPWLVLALTQAWRAQISSTLRGLRLTLALIAGVMAAAGLLWSAIALNPLFQSYADGVGAKVMGPPLLDTLALSYAMPALMLIYAARQPVFPRPLRLGMLTVGAALMALYAGLEIRRFWQGDWLGAPGVTQYELYSYTLALMLAGAAILYLAIVRRSALLRRIGMAVIAVTVAKVFLIDASGLTGLTRVFSFLGLGLSLAGLAWLNRWAGQASTPQGQ